MNFFQTLLTDSWEFTKYTTITMRSSSPVKIEHLWRNDITGLRAVAVLPVLLFHAFPNLLPGGFFGVDVFFVISGYLISGIIFRGLIDGTFSYRREFLEKRYSVSESTGQSGRIFCVNPSSAQESLPEVSCHWSVPLSCDVASQPWLALQRFLPRVRAFSCSCFPSGDRGRA